MTTPNPDPPSLIQSKQQFNENNSLQTESLYYKWLSNNNNYIVEAKIREDNRYKITILISDSETEEIYTAHKTKWLSLGIDTDTILQGIYEEIGDERQFCQIYFDLYTRVVPFGLEYIKQVPLFARFYTSNKYKKCNKDDLSEEFFGNHELWLTCDINLNAAVVKFSICEESMRLVYEYEYDYITGDDDFYTKRMLCKSPDPIKSECYTWIVNELEKFYRRTHGKEITNSLEMISGSLIDMIIGYVI